MTSVPQPARIPVCGIGASAGGVDALQQFFGALAEDLGLAYVVILHLAPDRKSELPTILQRSTKMPVVQVADREKQALEPNHVYVIGPDRKLEITDTSVAASSFEQPRGQRSAIDLFFRSLAEQRGDGFAVVLSGSGSDGALGAKAVKEAGGLVLVQDPEEAAHGDMPRAAMTAAIADVILPVRELAARLGDLARHKAKLPAVARAADDGLEIPEGDEKALRQALEVLRKRTGHDFSKYKRSTVLRRLSRRMQLAHQFTIADYVRHIRANPPEVQALFDDLLISVTAFFRDPDSWAALQRQVIAPLVERTDPDHQIRAWVPGCATGEEAYSLAIAFHEEFERQRVHRSLMIFASDIDGTALAMARDGMYPLAIKADVSESRLKRFFRVADDHVRIVNEIRDHLVFAEHNVLRDPPFSRLDLISCRNLLIYLDRDIQEQLMGVFRYACRDGAALFLGASETADENLFQPVDKKHRILSARPRSTREHRQLPAILAVSQRAARPSLDVRLPARVTSAELHVSALEELSAPTAIVDERGNVLHVSASAARFFQQGSGAPTSRLTDLVRPELRDEAHRLLHRVTEAAPSQMSAFVPVRFNGAPHRVVLLAHRKTRPNDSPPHFLVTFLDAGEAPPVGASEAVGASDGAHGLREQLRSAEQRIDSMRDEHFATNEDLRAANEELQSLNEEYRSTTEELETSKEELQSVNEELQTVNQELKAKFDEVKRAHSDLENLIVATDVATLFLGRDLRIRWFTPKLGEIFNVKSRDIGRPIGDLTHSLDYGTLEADVGQVMASQVPVIRDLASASGRGRSYIVRLGPYRTSHTGEMDGVVATFIDVTLLKDADAALRESERKLEAELQLTRRLHAMSLSVATSRTMAAALDHVLVAAVDLQGAQFGNIQMADSAPRRLRIVAHQGFGRPFLDHFASVGVDEGSSCARAWRSGRSCQVADVTTDPDYAEHRDIAAQTGYRAVQSTPLVERGGGMVGVLSVHFASPRVFTDRDRRIGELLGQQAADLLANRIHQQQLTELNEALRTRTAELESSREQLARQAADLLEQDHHRQEFLAALGHELRNPMAAMQSSLELMSVSDDVSQRALTILKRQSRHMTRLVNDLLDVTRVNYGRLFLERRIIDINQSVLAAVETARAQAERKHLTLEAQTSGEPVHVDADPERIAQVLDNLLRNAVTYTDAGSVTIIVTADANFAIVTVRDTGVGVDGDTRKSLFKPYEQRRDHRPSTGLGLGLALVKGIVEAHGGIVSVESQGRGNGSEFTFTIPLAGAEPQRISGAPAPRLVRHRVLVVDDNPDVATVLGAILGTLGQDVRVAHNGKTGLAMARQHRPRMAFVDISMPEMTGPELARHLRQEFPPDALTLVAVTGYSEAYARAEGELFEHYLLKPVTSEALASLLAELAS